MNTWSPGTPAGNVSIPSSRASPSTCPCVGPTYAPPASTTAPPPSSWLSVRPPTRGRASSTTTERPARVSSRAAVRPARPAPTTTTSTRRGGVVSATEAGSAGAPMGAQSQHEPNLSSSTDYGLGLPVGVRRQPHAGHRIGPGGDPARGRVPRREHRRRGVVAHDAVAAGALGPVEQLVGAGKERCARVAGAGAAGREADADRRRDRGGHTVPAVDGDRTAQLRERGDRLGRTHVRGDDHELLAAEPDSEAVGGHAPGVVGEDRPELAQDRVAGLVRVLVVDPLEMVDVDHRERQLADADQLREPVLQVAAVVHAGERVADRKLLVVAALVALVLGGVDALQHGGAPLALGALEPRPLL